VKIEKGISLEDLVYICRNLHDANKAELRALGYAKDMSRALLLFHCMSVDTWSILDGDTPVMICGVDSTNKFWLMFSEVSSLPVSFFKQLQVGLDDLFRTRKEITGLVFLKNTFAVQLIRHFKGEFKEPAKNGFISFSIRRR